MAAVAAGLVLAPSPSVAQEGAAATAQAGATQPPTRPRDIQLVFEREVFSYAAASRRDPFRSLADQDGIGPLFDDLKLRMIIHSDQPGQSVALVVDGAKKVYRLRKGDVVGNATVLDINAERVTFSVEDFGNRRQEVLDLKAQNQKEGA
jgi:hypothetical protein